jgi:hypothetical protein
VSDNLFGCGLFLYCLHTALRCVWLELACVCDVYDMKTRGGFRFAPVAVASRGWQRILVCDDSDFGWRPVGVWILQILQNKWFWTLSRPYNRGVLPCSKVILVILFMYIFPTHSGIGGVFPNIGGGISNIGGGIFNKTSDFKRN